VASIEEQFNKLKENIEFTVASLINKIIGRLPRPDIVHFRSACRGTEIFLRELTLLNTLSSNPKSSRSVDLAFSYKLLFYLH
jgi:hypothetical protein